jgi:cytochrome P450
MAEERVSTSRYSQAAMSDLFDFSAPQPGYIRRIEEGGFLEPMPGMALCYSRQNGEYVMRHHEQFTSRIDMGLGNVRPLIPMNVDPPLHSKYRKLLDPLFSPRRMDEQEEDITRRVNGFIDAFVDRGECDFGRELADVYPSSVFLGLLGLPEQEMPLFLRLRDGIVHPERWDENAAVDADARRKVLDAAGAEIYEYFGALVTERRQRPAVDIVTRFIEAEVDGDRLTDEDILDICFLVVLAGLDTVSDTLTCSYAVLAQNPAHQRMIVDDPGIIPNAVEELLRWETPVPQSVPRIAQCPVELPTGEHIEPGSAVIAMLGAMNVDPEVYDYPLDVRFDRENNPHVAFGGGVHRCLGSHLARRELRIALREWHRRIPEYRLKPGHEQLEYPPGLRHVKDLVLSWG